MLLSIIKLPFKKTKIPLTFDVKADVKRNLNINNLKRNACIVHIINFNCFFSITSFQ
jgi:hypothetical protein